MSLTGANTAISFSTGNTLGFAHTCGGGDCNGDPTFAEILLYDRQLSEAERLANEAYLAQKYFGVPEPGASALLGGLALATAARVSRRHRNA